MPFRASILSLVLALVSGTPGGSGVEPPLAITGVTVIDVESRASLAPATILIRNGRIRALGPDGSVPIPADAWRLDGAGTYAIPGLWDMHVHLSAVGRRGLATLLEYGITSVRDLGGRTDSVLRWRNEIEAGALRGPRIMAAGPIVENAAWLERITELDVPGIAQLANERIGIATPDDARAAADSIARLGVAVLKVRTSPRPDTYAALLDEANRRGLFVAGHQPSAAVGLDGAIRAGQRSIEHIEQLGELADIAPARRDSILRAVRNAPVWFTPTLVASFGRFRPDSVIAAEIQGDGSRDAYGALVTPELRAFWRQQLALKQFDAPREEYERMVIDGLAGMRRLAAAGARLLAGTDLAVMLLYPGLALHGELELMVDSLRLTPLDAIRSATLEPARYFRMTDSLGTLAVGKVADLVLLDADPRESIRHTKRIRAVVSRGRVVFQAGR